MLNIKTQLIWFLVRLILLTAKKICSLPVCPLFLDRRFFESVLRGLRESTHITICGQEKKKTWRHGLKILQTTVHHQTTVIISHTSPKSHMTLLICYTRGSHLKQWTSFSVGYIAALPVSDLSAVSATLLTACGSSVLAAAICSLSLFLSGWRAAASYAKKQKQKHSKASILEWPGNFMSSIKVFLYFQVFFVSRIKE